MGDFSGAARCLRVVFCLMAIASHGVSQNKNLCNQKKGQI